MSDAPAPWKTKIREGMLSSGGVVFVMLAMLAIPAALTLHSVRTPATIQIHGANPTPHGYTWSLLLFLVPIAMIAFWFLPQQDLKIPRRPFWTTLLLLVPIGFGLDFFFAKNFFHFDSPLSTLGWMAPARGHDVPVEEYVFYLTGFIVVLLLYIWFDEYWLRLYREGGYQERAQAVGRLLQFHPASLVFGALLIGAAWLYRRAHVPGGFPGYWIFLVSTAAVPSAALFPVVKRFINWRAFSLTMFMILLVSMFWEATLAVPYQWWGYNPDQMMGLSIGAWAGLPIEAVCLWIAVTYATLIVFEAVRIWDCSGKKIGDVLFGGKSLAE